MQMQLPFAVMRLCYVTMKHDNPEANTFLWDGSYDLPTLHLNLHVDQSNLSCIPSSNTFESVLMDLTSMVRHEMLVVDLDFVHSMLQTSYIKWNKDHACFDLSEVDINIQELMLLAKRTYMYACRLLYILLLHPYSYEFMQEITKMEFFMTVTTFIKLASLYQIPVYQEIKYTIGFLEQYFTSFMCLLV